ncbi:MAG: sialidase family protein [Desulfuromonadaceae bacterium]
MTVTTELIIQDGTYLAYPSAPWRRADGSLAFIYARGVQPLWPYRDINDIWLATSTDNGETWATEYIFEVGGPELEVVCNAAAGITSTGTELVILGSLWVSDIPTWGMTYHPVQVWRKPAGGSWGRVDDIAPYPAEHTALNPGSWKFTVLPNGTIRLLMQGWNVAKTVAYLHYVDSTDDGLSWSDPVVIFSGTISGSIPSECSYYADGDNHVIVARVHDEVNPATGCAYFTSADAGVNWSYRGLITEDWVTLPTLHRLRDSRLAMFYGNRTRSPRTMSIRVGEFADIMAGAVGAWSEDIIVAEVESYYTTDMGYGGLFEAVDGSDASLSAVYFGGGPTVANIYQATGVLPAIGAALGYRVAAGACHHNLETARLIDNRIATVYDGTTPYTYQLVDGVPVEVATPSRIRSY